MENVVHSSSDTITADSINSDESLSHESNMNRRCETFGIIDLEKFFEINDYQNDEENYEKLSEVIEEPEDASEITIAEEILSPSKEILEKNRTLQERISSLNNVITSLRDELEKEISLWRKERDEFQILQEKSDLLALEEANAAARAAAEAYAAEGPLSDEIDFVQYNCCNFTTISDILDVNPEQTLSELTILEYEKKLAKYQDALAFAQAEKRYNMRRQLAANTYRQKLIEVERLCDEELEKIKQNANSLQPLKQMISQWYSDDRCSGDADKLADSSKNETYQKDYQSSPFNRGNVTNIGKVDSEVNMIPEIFVAKFNVDRTSIPSCDKTQSGSNWIETDYNRQISISTNPFSLKWESSNYKLSTSLGNL